MVNPLDSRSQAFIDSLNRISARMDRAQRQISTGQRFSSVSDDPDQVSTLLQARADLESTINLQQNLGRIKAEVDTGDQALQSAVAVLERVRTLGTQAATGTATADARQTIAGEIGSLLEQLGGLSRTTVEGRYIFSGDNDQTAPYMIDLTQPNPISTYAGSSSTRQVQHPNGTRFSVSKTAQEIFDNPDATKNVFYSVNNLRIALQNNDEASISGSLENVMGSLTYLNNQLASYGGIQNKVASATDFAERAVLQLRTHVGSLQDADLTQAIIEMQQANTQQQAALQSRAQVPRRTLFDYLG